MTILYALPDLLFQLLLPLLPGLETHILPLEREEDL